MTRKVDLDKVVNSLARGLTSENPRTVPTASEMRHQAEMRAELSGNIDVYLVRGKDGAYTWREDDGDRINLTPSTDPKVMVQRLRSVYGKNVVEVMMINPCGGRKAKRNPVNTLVGPGDSDLPMIYGQTHQITMTKTNGPYKGELFFHDFKRGVRQYGIPEGTRLVLPGGRSILVDTKSVVITSKKHLWKQH